MRVVAIVGAGFTGVLTAAWLLRLTSSGPLRIILIERLAKQAGGVAYGTSCRAHVLNVPAGRMSAYANDADHFLRWAQLIHPTFRGGSFLPRALYGQYLRDLLDEAVAHAAPGHQLERMTGEVERIDPPAGGKPAIAHFSDGRTLETDSVVLAVGNCPPRDPPIADPTFYSDETLYARDPWATGATEKLDPAKPIMLIGTGLTMYDIALQISLAGHTGVMHALSRRGFVPQPHRASAAAPHGYPRPADLDQWPATALGTFKALRAEIRKAAQQGVDWREVVTALRADTPALWKKWDRRSREQFLRHLRSFWETHRHRAAPEAATGVQRLRASKRLLIHAGRLVDITRTDQGARVTFRSRGDDARELVVQRVINCTGPESDPRYVRNTLLRSLAQSGLLTADPLGLGIQTADDGAALDKTGRAQPWLSVVGPFRRASLWENTAVPELRVEAERLARRLVGSPPSGKPASA